MKYTSKKTLRRAKKAFSLIELMIVIVIIGALTAIILPQFDISEAEAKDTACDTSNYGTLRQLASFRSVNGVYPMGLHTGLESSGTSEMGGSEGSPCQALPDYTNLNVKELIGALNEGQSESLRNAGIVYVASGGFPKSSDNATAANFTMTIPVNETPVAILSDENDIWYENFDEIFNESGTLLTGSDLTDNGTAPLTINGVELGYYAYPNAHVAASGDTDEMDTDGAVVALFVTPNVDWDNYWSADEEGSTASVEGQSRLGVAQVGGCPWLEGGADFRYYIAFFKVFDDGSAAKLIGTSCPEGGSLNP